jgi:hypothetical protein
MQDERINSKTECRVYSERRARDTFFQYFITKTHALVAPVELSSGLQAKKASVCRVTSAWSRNMWPHQPPLGRTFSLNLVARGRVGSVYVLPVF